MEENIPPKEIFKTGAVRRPVSPSLISNIPTEFIIALGERYHLGAELRGYGAWNWAKGIPYDNLIQHAATHLFLLGNQLSGENQAHVVVSEDNARGNAAAVAWGMACITHFLKFGNPAENK